MSAYLTHSGILGMKWGIRRYQNEDGSLTEAGKQRYLKNVDRDAKKDARRYVNAKQYYGEGAGNRRKLLKGELSKKMKDENYKKAFDKYVAEEDYAKATKRAIRERKTRDTAKTAKRIAKIAAPIAVTVALSLYAANKQKVDAKVSEIFRNAQQSWQHHQAVRSVNDLFGRVAKE